MKRIFSIVLSLFLCLPLIIYAKETAKTPEPKYPVFDNIEALYLYHTDAQYFKKGLHNKELTDTECLTYIIYGEARGEPDDGQVAVGFVVKNRAMKWGKTLCEVARMPGEFESHVTKLYGRTDEEAWWHALNIAYFLNHEGGYATVKSPVDDAIYFNSLPADQQSVMGKGRFRGKLGHHYFYGAKRK
jgi:hypothetical protein